MVNIDEVKQMVNNDAYSFLREDAHLGSNIMFLTLGGSKAYGTDVDSSDTDIRGCTGETADSLLGLQKVNTFEQYVDTVTDTVVYSFSKLVELLISCNPNTIEMLGCKPEHYFYCDDRGKMLIDNGRLFLSRVAIKSFGGYAGAQLRRLTNALARDKYSQSEKEKHIYNSCMNILNTFDNRHREMEEGSIQLYIDNSIRTDMETEIYVDIALKHYPLRDMQGIFNELFNVIRDYEKIGKRNHKKDDLHLNKHAMHLIRLYLMGIDILEKEKIITNREENHELLMSIRNGEYQKEDGTYKEEFFILLNNLDERFKYAAKNTSLPETPDMNKINDLVMEINTKSIKG